jgi:hypothetical protein
MPQAVCEAIDWNYGEAWIPVDWQSVRRSPLLPSRVVLEILWPALSLVPGHNPPQEANWCAEGYGAIFTPISATS